MTGVGAGRPLRLGLGLAGETGARGTGARRSDCAAAVGAKVSARSTVNGHYLYTADTPTLTHTLD